MMNSLIGGGQGTGAAQTKQGSDKILGGHMDAYTDDYQSILNKVDAFRVLIQNENEFDQLNPSIVVCGDQSMGKSSVLEIITGVNLPRGDGTKTRVPLEIRLRNAKSENEEKIEIAAQFQNNEISNHQIIQECEISNTIEEFTNLLAGKEKNIVDSPIILTIYRRKYFDLTVIDLPGIIRNSKDRSLPGKIRKMIQRYMKNPQTIILNVVSCMVDAVTAESIRMSQDIDSECKRSLIVFTFLDSNELDSSIPGKFEECQKQLGFHTHQIYFVRNRTKLENENNISLSQVQLNEMEFFNDKYDNKLYDPIPRECLGSQQLAKKLVELQKEKILSIIPIIRDKLHDRINELLDKLDLCNNKDGINYIDIKNKSQANGILCRIVNELFDSLKQANHGLTKLGTTINIDKNSINNELICADTFTMYEKFRDKVRFIKKPRHFLNPNFLNQLRKKQHDSRAFPSLPGSHHPRVAMEMISQMVFKIQDPAHELLDEVCDYVKKRILPIIAHHTSHLPRLHQTLDEIIIDLLKEYKRECKKDIEKFIEWESAPLPMDPRYYQKLQQIEHLLSLKTIFNMDEYNIDYNDDITNSARSNNNNNNNGDDTLSDVTKRTSMSAAFSSINLTKRAAAIGNMAYGGGSSNNNNSNNHSNSNSNSKAHYHRLITQYIPFEIEVDINHHYESKDDNNNNNNNNNNSNNNSVPTGAIGIYTLQSAPTKYNNYHSIYTKMNGNKLYTLTKDENNNNKWVLIEVNIDTSDMIDWTNESKINEDANNNTRIIAKQLDSNNKLLNPIFVERWDNKSIYVNSFDLLSLMAMNINKYNKMERSIQDMYRLSMQTYCYWNDIICVGICRTIPQCVMNLVNSICGAPARDTVQQIILSVDNVDDNNNNIKNQNNIGNIRNNRSINQISKKLSSLDLISMDPEIMKQRRKDQETLAKLEDAYQNILSINGGNNDGDNVTTSVTSSAAAATNMIGSSISGFSQSVSSYFTGYNKATAQ